MADARAVDELQEIKKLLIQILAVLEREETNG